MSDFFAKKIKTLYERFDMDKNGLIEEDDFDTWSEKLIAIGNLDKNQSQDLITKMKAIWTNYFLPADVDNDGSVTVDELIIYMRSALNDESKRKTISDTLPVIFDAIDANRDGGIETHEFKNYFLSFGLNDDDFTLMVFKNIDVDGDGDLSKDEFTQFGTQFFLCNDESHVSKYFFGPLVQ